MLPPTHFGVGTLPSKELYLMLVRQERIPIIQRLTMSALPEFLPGPRDIRVKAPGTSREGWNHDKNLESILAANLNLKT